VDPKKADILQHIGFSLRSKVARVAEVMNVRTNEIMLHANNDTEAKYIKRFDVLRWWEVVPKLGETPPAWVKKGAVFRPREERVPNRAVIMTAHTGWVSFYDRQEGYPQVFRIVEYEEFKLHWQPDNSPTVWDRILDEFLC
jgi:hypothetical protein